MGRKADQEQIWRFIHPIHGGGWRGDGWWEGRLIKNRSGDLLSDIHHFLHDPVAEERMERRRGDQVHRSSETLTQVVPEMHK